MRLSKALLALCRVISACHREHITTVRDLAKDYEQNAIDRFDAPLSGILAVMKDDSVYYKGGFGSTYVNESSVPDGDTRFYIGSLTKQFTAVLILKLAQEEILSLHDSIYQYLPVAEDKRNITIHQLLSNTPCSS